MTTFLLDSKIINQNVNKLDGYKNYFSGKKNSFYSSNSVLENNLTKINNIYSDILDNINSLKEFISSLSNDVVGIEKLMSGGSGTIKSPYVSSIVRGSKNIIDVYEVDSNNLFTVIDFKAPENKKTTMTLAFQEGIDNVLESLIDGGAMLVADVSSLLGNDSLADKIGDFVKTDLSKETYYSLANGVGLSEYVDSTGAKACSIAGNIFGSTVLSYGIGELSAAMFGLTEVAELVTSISRGVVGFLRDSGSGSEKALQDGSTIEEAEVVGAIDGAIGLGVNWLSGKFDMGARRIGASKGKAGINKMLGISAGSFGLGAFDPASREMVHTLMYDNEGNIINNYLENAKEDGLVMEMLTSGISNFFGTLLNGLSGIKTFEETSKYDSLVKADEFVKENEDALYTKEDISINEQDLQLKIDRYNQLVIMMNSEHFIKSAEMELEFTNLKKELIEIAAIDSNLEIIDSISNQKKINLSGVTEALEVTITRNMDLKTQPILNVTQKGITVKDITVKDITVKGTTVKDIDIDILESQKKLINNVELRNRIVDKFKDVEDLRQKARALYMELNQNVHYSANFLAGTDEVKNLISSQRFSFEDFPENHSVTCRGWSALYRELLIESGFSESNVKIQSTQSGGHFWVEIDLGDDIIIADATDAINHIPDLSSSKIGYKTNGFLELDKQYSGKRIYSLVKNNQLTDETIQFNDDINSKNDKILGFANDKGYKHEQLSIADKLFKKLKRNVAVDSTDVLNFLFNQEIPKNVDGLEYYSYYRKVVREKLSPEELAKIRYSYYLYKTPEGIISIFGGQFFDGNTDKYFTYDSINGKQIFTDKASYNQFIMSHS